jgi:hypothetical protein
MSLRAPLALLFALAALLGCRDKERAPEPVSVGRLSVSWVELSETGTAVRDESMERSLAGILEKAVDEEERIVSGAEKADPLELAVVASPSPGEQADSVDLVYTLRTTHGDGWRLSATIATRLAADEASDPARSREVVGELVDDLLAQLELFDDDDRALERLVTDEEANPDARATAIRILGERGSVSAVPSLVAALGEAEAGSPLIEDIVGALARIGDERASPALIDAFSRARGHQAILIVDALGRTGGEEARLFLDVVASGHESPVVRDHARRALSKL